MFNKKSVDFFESQFQLRGIRADIENWTIDQSYDTIVVIGLLMFFRQETALKVLTAIQEHVKPSGRAIVKVLIEGTTYLGMFDPDNYYLFRRNELEERFEDWTILESRTQTSLRLRGRARIFRP
jgi:tellurite methyltransferase